MKRAEFQAPAFESSRVIPNLQGPHKRGETIDLQGCERQFWPEWVANSQQA